MKKRNSSDEYYTPPKIYKPLGSFEMDPCAGPISCIAKINIRPPEDGLTVEWKGLVWLNPPFSTKHKWISKLTEYNNGIALLPVSTGAKWFKTLAKNAGQVFFFMSRIEFINGTSRNTGYNALFPFGYEAKQRIANSNLDGYLMNYETDLQKQLEICQ